MMNPLKEYRDKGATDTWKKLGSPNTNIVSSYKEGFDAAIALELPVKFIEWVLINKWERHSDYRWKKYIWNELHIKSNKQLYEYWIDKVYKPDQS